MQNWQKEESKKKRLNRSYSDAELGISYSRPHETRRANGGLYRKGGSMRTEEVKRLRQAKHSAEAVFRALLDKKVIDSWYYNGTYTVRVGNITIKGVA